MNSRIPFRVRPMLATLTGKPFNTIGWVYEEKYDGDRIIAYKDGPRVHLLSRKGEDRTDRFPGITAAIRNLKSETLLLDGEVVVLDKQGVSRFQLLQQGGEKPAYMVFDCLFHEGKDLRREPLSTRRAEMEKSIGSSHVLLASHRLAVNGLEAFRIAPRRGYEGLVAKDLSSPYLEERSNKWLKVKIRQEDEFVIGGFTEPGGSRKHFGALLLGAYKGRQLHYVGKVGTGFSRNTLTLLSKKFQTFMRTQSSFVDLPSEKGTTFLAPKLVAQISFQEWTQDRKLRQPVYLGLRDDKDPLEVLLPEVSK